MQRLHDDSGQCRLLIGGRPADTGADDHLLGDRFGGLGKQCILRRLPDQKLLRRRDPVRRGEDAAGGDAGVCDSARVKAQGHGGV